jgi:hypothetical protein
MPLPEDKLEVKPVEEKKLNPDAWGDDVDTQDPEWIILFGATRTGKSYQKYDMIQYAAMVNPEMRAFEINMDRSAKRDLENFPLLLELKTVKSRYCQTIEDVMRASNEICKMVRPGDFIIVDRATTVWDMFPDYWCRTRLQKSADLLEFEHQTKDEGKIKGGSALLQHYSRGINPLWMKWETALRISGAHCIFVCTEMELMTESSKVRDKDSQEKLSAFAEVGHCPKMQGDTWSRWHTQLYLSRPYTAKRFFVKTVGDRGNRIWLGEKGKCELGSSPDDGLGIRYLRDVAGWGL